MKKSLLALAVLAGFAGAASAQTNVTIYGLVDLAVTRADLAGGDAAWQLDSSGNYNKNGSRLGFRGTEDLGGGLSAIFTLENGFAADTGNAAQGGLLFGRQVWAGVQGGFGALKFGRQYTPMHLALDSIDPFGTGMAGALNTQFNPNGTRMNNTVNYSFSAAGLTAQVAYAFGEIAGETTFGRQVAAGLGFVNGPLNVQFAYHDSDTSPALIATATAANRRPAAETRTAFLGATYDLRAVKVHAAFQIDRDEAGGVVAGVPIGTTTLKDRNFMVGVSAPIGAGEVRASAIRRDDRLTGAGTGDIDQYSVGYVHNLSKRSNVYTSYGRILSDRASVADGNIFNVGLQHKF